MPDAVQLRKRHIAHKLKISDILSSNFVKSETFPNYIDFNGNEVSRINLIGVVVEKSNFENYRNLAIEDGTGRISARIFESIPSFEKIKIGDFVVIIGRPREFLSERYLLIEIIKAVDDSWARVRKSEMEMAYPAKNLQESHDYIFEDNYKNKIVKAIKEMDKGDGVSVEEVFSDSDYNGKIIDMLLKEGNVFEVKPGKLKVLE